ncbi:MAG: hybrid sensor histidine kinase/response regulator [Halobacteriovoraceae bacterium]|nr:hybrid sensor histidine kinase/response regulator [Halobacteriovoraceae bacterium]
MKEKIYIVDDTLVFLKLFTHLLSDYETKTFINPDEAFEAITTDPPDLILSDLEMPKTNGIELLKKIRSLENTKNIPMIICTSHDGEDMLQEAFREGVTDFLSKDTVSGLVLNIRVRNILDSIQKTKKIEQMDQEKNTFLRVLCHDIVNPLSIAKGFHRILTQTIVNPDEKVQHLFKSLGRSHQKIEEILAYTRERLSIDDNKKHIVLTPLKVSTLLNDLDFLIKSRFQEKNINYQVVCENLDLEFLCEKSSITNQVFANLFTNAIKFTEKNGTISFSIYEENDHIIFKLRDSGIGMPKDLVDKLFDPNTTTSRPGTDGEKGTGYGLPLVKTFIESYGGQIEAHSHDIEEFPDDHWSEFIIKLKKSQNI